MGNQRYTGHYSRTQNSDLFIQNENKHTVKLSFLEVLCRTYECRLKEQLKMGEEEKIDVRGHFLYYKVVDGEFPYLEIRDEISIKSIIDGDCPNYISTRIGDQNRFVLDKGLLSSIGLNVGDKVVYACEGEIIKLYTSEVYQKLVQAKS